MPAVCEAKWCKQIARSFAPPSGLAGKSLLETPRRPDAPLSRSEHATVGVTGVALHLAREEVLHLNIRDVLQRIGV